MRYSFQDEEEDRRRLTRRGAADQFARLAERGRARLAALDPAADVRSAEIEHRYDPVGRVLLASGINFALWVFHTSPDGAFFVPGPGSAAIMSSVGNQPLGPLADVQVHATDPHGECAGQWRGKSHGVCRYQTYLSPDSHELLTLAQFLPLHQRDPGSTYSSGSGWCSQCGGYAVRRLTDEEFSYYVRALRQAEEGIYRRS